MSKNKYIAIAAVVVVVGGYYWYSSRSTTQPVQYKTATVEKGVLTTSVSGSGNVVVDQISTIDPTITGTVANLAVKVGDSVKKGQLLFTIVNDQLGVNASKATSSLESADVQLKQSKADLKDAKKATSGKSSAQKAVLQEKIDSAKSNLVAVQADYQNQLSISAKRKVVATIDGTVNAINIKNGDDLSRLSGNSASQAPIVIGDLGTLKAQVQVNEVDISNVKIGQKTMLKFGAIDGLSLAGKVEKMDSLGTIAQGVVTYNVTIGFDTLDPRVKPEMSVSASIITDVKQDVIVVPNSAVKTQSGNSFAQVMNGGATTPQQVSVEIGAANNIDTEIISGLNVGDTIVTQTINPSATSTSATSGGSGVKLPGLGGGGRGGFGG